jgi:hypothetical protein
MQEVQLYKEYYYRIKNIKQKPLMFCLIHFQSVAYFGSVIFQFVYFLYLILLPKLL